MEPHSTSKRAFDPVLGDPRFAPRYAAYEVKGTLLGARRRYVQEEYGAEALAKLKGAVSAEARQYLDDDPLPFAWYPLEVLVEIDRQIVLGPMDGRVAEMKYFGDRIARYDLNTLYKMLFKLGTPSFVLKRIGTAYGLYFRGGGGVRAESLGDRRMQLSFRDAVQPYYMCKYGISGWLHASVDLSGGRNIGIDHERCVHSGDPTCVWKVSWG